MTDHTQEALEECYDALEAFALDKWGDTNPILVPDDDKPLQKAYLRACPYAPSVMRQRLSVGSDSVTQPYEDRAPSPSQELGALALEIEGRAAVLEERNHHWSYNQRRIWLRSLAARLRKLSGEHGPGTEGEGE